ncbi:protein kinase [Paenibacillus sp. NEAU-GSW1]|uniref:protein kinase domain-containing protein n=1 Tax=Paenibacillus sp. NEAU-GSW1 TaxID=2682486 RepID=UPI0012E302AE|nr:protein kinase [Paenibacillus sp. NEAU-GSW1]MUT65221.1 protein kinase [Paenibacillus sp. NEAU-GSW1]
MSINFQFLLTENEELYNKCSYAEQFSKTFPNNSMLETRRALEFFLQRECRLRNIQFTLEENPYKSAYPSIYQMIKKTADELQIFTPVQKKAMNKIRRLGNDSAHVEYKGEDRDVELDGPVSTGQAIAQIKAMHELLRQFFAAKYKEMPPFDENLIPIDSMIPETVIPAEQDEACQLKLRCKIVNEETSNEMYYMVRQYTRAQLEQDKTFILRDMYTLEKLSQGSLASQNVVKYIRVNVQKQNELLFTCFEINRDAVSLDHYPLGQLSVKERLQIIEGIANGIEELHTNSTPIIHRFLCPSSIYIGANRKPQICNFEYSKLENSLHGTVQDKVIGRKSPYTAPILSNENMDKNWPSADIYSLGVIILYMFGLPVQGELNPDKLIKSGISKPFIESIHDMLSDVAAERPAIHEVKPFIQQEAARHA